MWRKLANWKHGVFKALAAICILALLTQPEIWHMLFLLLDASTLDVFALLLELQVALAVTLLSRRWLWPVAARTWNCVCGIGRAFRYQFFMIFMPGSQDLAFKWKGPLFACVWLWWTARDHRAGKLLAE